MLHLIIPAGNAPVEDPSSAELVGKEMELHVPARYHTSRSAAILYNKCARARYWQYHWDGQGVVKDQLYLPFVVGGAVHKGLEYLLGKYIGYTGNFRVDDLQLHSWVAEACASAKEEFLSRVEGSSYDDAIMRAATSGESSSVEFLPGVKFDTDPRADYIRYLTSEQLCLVESMVAGFAFAEAGLKELLRTYEILEIEQEDSFPLKRDGEMVLYWESRADGLLRRRVDGALVVLSFKTASKYDARSRSAAESDVQGMSEVIAVQERLLRWQQSYVLNHYATIEGNDEVKARTQAEINLTADWAHDYFQAHGNLPTQVEAVQMIHLIKGSQKADAHGLLRQENSVIRPWVKRNQFSEEGDDYRFVARWKAVGPRGGEKWETLGGSYTRVNLWEEAVNLQCEIWELIYAFSQAKDEELNASPLERMVVFPEVVCREPENLDRWLREVTAQEWRIYHALHQHREGLPTEVLDEIFPHTGSSTGACAYWNKGFNESLCAYFNMCWGSRYFSEDPLSSGYVRRTPNHPGEAQQIELIQIQSKKDQSNAT